MNVIRDCELCELSKYRKEVGGKIVWGSGNPGSNIMLVGEAPGETGETFRDRGGKYLRSEFQKYIDVEEDMYITNSVFCCPPGNRQPTLEEKKICFCHLQTQIMTMKPKLIITTGEFDWISKYSVYNISVMNFGYELAWLPLYHPAYILKNYEERLRFQDILKRKYSKILGKIAQGSL